MPVAVLMLVGASFLTLAVPLSAQPNVVPSTHPRITNGTGSSTNWSGYAVTGPAGSVTSVEGSWVAPSVTCSATNSYAAFWVGIDGYSSSTVEQTGTMAECQGGTPSYYAWYEFYPSGSFLISSVPVSPGNTMSAAVTYSATTGMFTTTITDVTTGNSYKTSQAVASAQESSAEWIAEAPSSCSYTCSVLPLANFGTAVFGSDNTGVASTNYATVSGVTGTIGSFGSAVQEITMVSNSGSVEAQPSAVSSDGTSFTVAWGGTTTTSSSSSSSSSSTSTSSSSSSSSTSSTSTSTSTSSSSTSTTSSSQLVVTVTTNRDSYSPGSRVTINVEVTTSTGSPVSRASVAVTLTTTSGGKATGSGSTSRDGTVTFVYQTARNAGVGTYTLSAIASASGYTSGSGSTTFQVT